MVKHVQYVAILMVVLGPALLAAGTFKVFAGVRNLKMQGRTLGLVALGSSLVAVPTCYCAPTARSGERPLQPATRGRIGRT